MMKAISLWQPWASLWITSDAKLHETRSWSTKHRDELAVHASKRPPERLTEADLRADLEACLILGKPYQDRYLPTGAIIAVITLKDCVPTVPRPDITARDYLFGNWEPDRFAWRRGPVVQILQQPVPCRGFQGIWRLGNVIEQQVRAQMVPQARAA